MLEFNQSQSLKAYIEFYKQKNRSRKKNGNKDRKALYKSMINAVYSKTLENLRNKIEVKPASNKKYCEPSYMSYKIFQNDLVAISKRELALMLEKSA